MTICGGLYFCDVKKAAMLKLIENEKQYEEVIGRVYELMQKDFRPDSKESKELEVLSRLVRLYEMEHYPVILGGRNY